VRAGQWRVKHTAHTTEGQLGSAQQAAPSWIDPHPRGVGTSEIALCADMAPTWVETGFCLNIENARPGRSRAQSDRRSCASPAQDPERPPRAFELQV
jgi:hypothetical protein